MTTNVSVIANVKQLRTDRSFRILLPFFRTSWGVGVLKSEIFNSFHNQVEFGTILEGQYATGSELTVRIARCLRKTNRCILCRASLFFICKKSDVREYFEDMTESGFLLQLQKEGTACKIMLPCWLLYSALFCFFAFPWQRCLRG